jgi:hypothetical protein
MEIRLSCSKCNTKFGGYGTDEFSVAEEADKEGWRVTRTQNVICPSCSKTKKKARK